jgi:hypothetical protein
MAYYGKDVYHTISLAKNNDATNKVSRGKRIGINPAT